MSNAGKFLLDPAMVTLLSAVDIHVRAVSRSNLLCKVTRSPKFHFTVITLVRIVTIQKMFPAEIFFLGVQSATALNDIDLRAIEYLIEVANGSRFYFAISIRYDVALACPAYRIVSCNQSSVFSNHYYT